MRRTAQGLRLLPARAERGTILIVVLLISLGLVVVTLYFADSMMLEYRGSDNAVAGISAGQTVEGARQYVEAVLRLSETPGLMPEPTSYEAEEVPVGEAAAFWLIGRDPNGLQAADAPTFELVDEAGKLNLNTATQAMLEGLPGMTTELAAAIVDWRDEDEEATADGAEAETYMMHDPPYMAKNGKFESVEEMRLVRGAEHYLLYGEDANLNGILDPNENDGNVSPPEDNQDGRLDPGLLDYVTAWSRESTKQSDGTARVDVRSTNTQALRQLLTDTLSEQRAQQIVAALGPTTLRSELEFYIRSGMTEDEFAKVEDGLTVSGDEFIEGRVNVNTAPEAVLACLPGIGTDNAPAVVAYRQGRTVDSLASIAWVSEALEREDALRAGPYLTTRSYVFSADIAALGHLDRGLRRELFVIDTVEETPRVIYRHDLTRLGWPLGGVLRESLGLAMP